MRQAGAIPNKADAQRFVDYLLTLGIEAKVDASNEPCAIWIYDETQLAQGKAELQQFFDHPQDARFAGVDKKAEALRRETQSKQRQASRNLVNVSQRWSSPGMRGPRPLTFLLIAASVLVGFITHFGKDLRPIFPYLYMTAIGRVPSDEEFDRVTNEAEQEGRDARISAIVKMFRLYDDSLPEIRHGQVWRLVTPIFIHMTLMHLLFNMLWLFVLGGMIEDRYGSFWLATLVIVTAVISNLTQFYWSGPLFGGMSGVNFALFGYIWMKSKFDPTAGLYIGERDVFLMLLWFGVCFTGWIGPVANGAHAGGLVAGIVLGYLPKLLRR